MQNDQRGTSEEQRIHNLNIYEGVKSRDIQHECWYPDIGATHHVTSNLQNLNLGNKEYKGTQSISLGNGTKINITHTGTGTINGQKVPHLNNVLRVPKIRKKIILMSFNLP